MKRPLLLVVQLSLLVVIAPGCGLPSLSGLVEGLNRQTDLELVCDGAPAFLLMLDSLIDSHPDDVSLLVSGTKAYSAYAAVMPECGMPGRAAALGEKARTYGLALLKEAGPIAPGLTLEELDRILTAAGRGSAEHLFWGAYGWATWINYQEGSPSSLIDLPSVEKIMLRVLELDETINNGGAHLFLGIYYGLKPAAYGGKPELSRHHFEKALAISGRRFLPVQVAYAEIYGKMVFDRELYEKLLREVLAFEISSAPDLTLGNLAARRKAIRLLAEIDEYF